MITGYQHQHTHHPKWRYTPPLTLSGNSPYYCAGASGLAELMMAIWSDGKAGAHGGHRPSEIMSVASHAGSFLPGAGTGAVQGKPGHGGDGCLSSTASVQTAGSRQKGNDIPYHTSHPSGPLVDKLHRSVQ